MGAAIGAAFAGISAAVASAGAFVGTGIAALGIGAETAGLIGTGIVSGGLVGAGLGGVESLATGRPFLKGVGEGALGGAVTGGAIGGLGGTIGSALGSTAAGDVIAGSIGGVAGAELTGGNPLIGAAGGALSGGIAAAGADSVNAPAGTAAPGGNATGISAPGVGAVGTAAPSSVGVDPSIGDVTSGPGVVGSGEGAGGGGFGGSNVGTAGTAIANADPGAPLVPGATTAGQALGGSTDLPAADAASLQAQQGLVAGGQTQSGLVTSEPVSPQEADAAGALADRAGGAATATNPAPNFFQTGGAGGGSSGGGNSITAAIDNPSFGTIGTALGNNANWLIPAAGLGLSAGKDLLSSGPSSTGLTSQLEGQANTLNANSQQLQSYLASGQLPAGVANSIHSATQSAKASIRSQYASRGMSGSSAEAQDLAGVDQRASAQGSQIALQLLQTGVSEAGLANSIYAQLLQHTTQQDAALSSAIGGFASSLVPRTTVNLTTQAA